MSKKQKITINDFNMFCEVINTATKILESAKITITPIGVEIYGAKERTARCELESNCITSDEEMSLSVKELSNFAKVLKTIKDIHENDYSTLNFTLNSSLIHLKSKKFETKFTTCDEAIIEPWITKKITATLEPVFEFLTSTEQIKKVLSHSYLFPDHSSTRVYIETRSDMEKNSVFASLGDRKIATNNEITLKLGLVTLIGDEQKQCIIDLDRLNLFNAIISNEIKISMVKDKNLLLSKTSLRGDNGVYFNFKLYNSMLKE